MSDPTRNETADESRPSIRHVFASIFRLYRETKEHFRWGLLRMLGGVGSASLGVLFAYLGGRMVGVALSGDMDVLIRYAVVMFSSAIARTLLMYANTHTHQRYCILSGKALRERSMAKIHALPIAYYESSHTGQTVSRLANDIETLSEFYGNSIAGIWSYVPVATTLSFVVLARVNLPLTLICGTAIPLFTYLIGKVSVPLGEISKKRQAKMAELNSILRDFVEGIGIYKAFNLHRSHGKRFEQSCADVTEVSFALSRKRSTALGLSILGMILPQVVAVSVGGVFVASGRITIDELFVFTNVLWPFLGSFQQISRGWNDMVEQTGRADHLFELFDADPERIDGETAAGDPVGGAPGAEAKRGAAGGPVVLEFEKVSYSYDDTTLLDGVSFAVAAGTKTALVGVSGSGKSTVHKLIRGFYDSYDGAVRIFGRELASWNLEALRARVAVVTQEVYLFNDSARENIRYARPTATDEEVVAAAVAAFAHEFIVELADGYDTVLGERGARLSGGQRQRVSIARAILSGRPLVLLDEPTSALDTKSEARVEEALTRLEEGRTVFVIAHRLSTIENADEILVLDAGRIVERGTHAELIAAGGVYTALYRRQEVV